MNTTNKPIFYVMGVCGSGKSTIGKLLSKKLEIPFFDGDDYHPKANVEKMAAGNALNDDDRYGWLTRLNTLAIQQNSNGEGAIIACSALKESYRKILSDKIEHHTEWVYLRGTFNEILDRMNKRKGHFMPSDLLRSQFDTLEPPTNAIAVSISNTPDTISSEILSSYKKKSY